MSQRVVYFNGRFVAESEARLSIYDAACLFGEMAYEVTRTFHGRPYRLRDHLQRLHRSLAAMRIDAGPEVELLALERLTLDTLARNVATEADDVDWSITHNISPGPVGEYRASFVPAELRPTVMISCYPLVERMAALAPAYEAGVELVVPEQRSIPSSLLDVSVKNRSRWHYRLAAIQAAERRPGSTPVLVDPDGHLTETTNANVFVVMHGELLTPEARNLLPGITRGVVLDLAKRLDIPAREANLTVDETMTADEIFLTATSIGVLHARSFEGVTIGDGAAGPLTLRLRAALEQEVGLDFAAQARAYAAKLSHPS